MYKEMRSCPNSSSLDVKLSVFSEMNLAIKHRSVDASSCLRCPKRIGLAECNLLPTNLTFLEELLELDETFYWENFDARSHVIEVRFCRICIPFIVLY